MCSFIPLPLVDALMQVCFECVDHHLFFCNFRLLLREGQLSLIHMHSLNHCIRGQNRRSILVGRPTHLSKHRFYKLATMLFLTKLSGRLPYNVFVSIASKLQQFSLAAKVFQRLDGGLSHEVALADVGLVEGVQLLGQLLNQLGFVF